MSRPLLVALLLLTPATLAGQTLVSASDGRVDVTATNAPVAEILESLARQTGMQLTYDGAPPRTLVTVRLEGVTEPQAVMGVLEGLGLGYASRLDRTGTRVETLLIVSTRPLSVPRPSAPVVPPPRPAPEKEPHVEEAFDADEAEEDQRRPDRPMLRERPVQMPTPVTPLVGPPAPGPGVPGLPYVPQGPVEPLMLKPLPAPSPNPSPSAGSPTQ